MLAAFSETLGAALGGYLTFLHRAAWLQQPGGTGTPPAELSAGKVQECETESSSECESTCQLVASRDHSHSLRWKLHRKFETYLSRSTYLQSQIY